MNLAYGKFVNYLTETINPDLQHFFLFLKMLTNTKIPTCFNQKASSLAQSCTHNIPCSTAVFAFI